MNVFVFTKRSAQEIIEQNNYVKNEKSLTIISKIRLIIFKRQGSTNIHYILMTILRSFKELMTCVLMIISAIEIRVRSSLNANRFP